MGSVDCLRGSARLADGFKLHLLRTWFFVVVLLHSCVVSHGNGSGMAACRSRPFVLHSWILPVCEGDCIRKEFFATKIDLVADGAFGPRGSLVETSQYY